MSAQVITTMSFGDWLRRTRKAAGQTAKQLAADCGISAQFMGDIEHGFRAPPSDPVLNTLAGLLHVHRDVIRYRAGRLPEGLSDLDVPDEVVRLALHRFRGELLWPAVSGVEQGETDG
jgi:transcriptional regulator with XRE-family HTH domain